MLEIWACDTFDTSLQSDQKVSGKVGLDFFLMASKDG